MKCFLQNLAIGQISYFTRLGYLWACFSTFNFWQKHEYVSYKIVSFYRIWELYFKMWILCSGILVLTFQHSFHTIFINILCSTWGTKGIMKGTMNWVGLTGTGAGRVIRSEEGVPEIDSANWRNWASHWKQKFITFQDKGHFSEIFLKNQCVLDKH